MPKTSIKRRKPNKACKFGARFGDALLEHFADLRLPLDDRKVFLEQASALYDRVGKKERFHGYIDQFFDEILEERSDTDKIGYYIKKRLKAKRLPNLRKSTDLDWYSTK